MTFDAGRSFAMSIIRRAAVTGLLAVWLAPLPSLAGSQSSNSSSNCSDGRCTRVESFIEENRFGRNGWTRIERWNENAPGARRERGEASRPGNLPGLPWFQPPRPNRGDDDDDD
jgi:hypothetical protein